MSNDMSNLEGSEESGGQKVRLYPVTRIQGRADIEVVFTPDHEVSEARFRALEVRGLDRLVVGMPAPRVPQVLSRICGSCGPFHQLASCMALENAAGAVVPPAAGTVRELLCWLWLAHSHLLSVIYTVLPDLALPMSDMAVRNITGIYMIEQEAVSRLFRIQAAFAEALGIVAGTLVHPALVVPGGVSSIPDAGALSHTAELLEECEDDLRETLRLLVMLIQRHAKMMYTGTTLAGHCMAVTVEGVPFPLGDEVTVKPFGEGEPVVLNHRQLLDGMVEAPVEWSYLVPASLQGADHLLTGPLSRMNMGYGPDTRWADLECNRCVEQWGRPLDREFLAYMALMLEVIRAWEKSRLLLEEWSPAGGVACTAPEYSAASGVSVVDSPRGVILHSVSVDGSGIVESYKVVSPLQFNCSMMNVHLSGVAREVVTGIEITDDVAQRLQLAVRAFNPCVPCGTH